MVLGIGLCIGYVFEQDNSCLVVGFNCCCGLFSRCILNEICVCGLQRWVMFRGCVGVLLIGLLLTFVVIL